MFINWSLPCIQNPTVDSTRPPSPLCLPIMVLQNLLMYIEKCILLTHISYSFSHIHLPYTYFMIQTSCLTQHSGNNFTSKQLRIQTGLALPNKLRTWSWYCIINYSLYCFILIEGLDMNWNLCSVFFPCHNTFCYLHHY